ncbi:hypothetical protein SAMN05444161_9219 [Rhizobiales bacterium GAS191]|nr:hypothetical protein SAMN05444161_9219 [Rhizobiales bacterium GAS191]
MLEQKDFGSLTVIFSSPGGNTQEGLNLYSFFRSLPVRVRGHAAGHVGSMGIPAFLGAHYRTMSKFSRFFFHPYDWTFPHENVLPERLLEANVHLAGDRDLSRQIVQGNSNLGADFLDRAYGTSTEIMTAQEALAAGLVQEIVELNDTGERQPNVKAWTLAW